ncbi:MAG: SMC-Scp complex subunit ScpB [Candidatus Bathyarchaeota archaeon]
MAANQELKPETDKPEEVEEMIALLEAALYVAGRPLDLKTLNSMIKTRSKKKTLALSRTLAQRYLERKGALELLELDDGRFVLQLKPVYSSHVRRLSMRPLLQQSPLRTLAYIAYRQPVAQAHLAAIRGSQIYTHIRELEDLGLITVEKLGRTKILRTTEVYADYFNLSHDVRLMKRQLKSIFDAEGKLVDEGKKGG